MTYISQSGATVSVSLGGYTHPSDSVDANVKALTLGGMNQPLLQYKITGNSLSVTAPAGYGGEPAQVVINGYLLESVNLATPAVASIETTAPAASSTITAAGTATAKVYDQYGELLPTQTVTWSSSATNTLTINAPTGAYVPVRDGAVTITATSSTAGSVTKTVTVSVNITEVVTSVTITAPEASSTLTESGTATAKVFDQNGDEMTGETVAWSSSDEEKLTIDESTGEYTLVADGDVTITATSSTDGTKSATVAVTVDATPAQNDS